MKIDLETPVGLVSLANMGKGVTENLLKRGFWLRVQERNERVRLRAPGRELGQQGLPHLAAQWYPLHGVGAPFPVPGGRSGWPPEKVLYAASFLHRG